MDRSTIAAICTPRGFGGVGIVKISGPDALQIARAIFRSKIQKDDLAEAVSFKAYRLRYGVIVQPEDGRRIDEVLLASMRAPKSYTGEDVVEINAHAGPVVLNSILDLVLEQGAHLAEPGEFTRRAFLNGRIDLTQAEAVVDLINAKTNAAARMASAQMAGQLRAEIEKIRVTVKQLITHNEARIDFPEDVVSENHLAADILALQDKIISPLKSIIDHYREGRILREGLRLAVVGRPNVGKSSLMNRLVRNDRAIVTDIPGTTRDTVEDFINIQGIPVVIVDTAGFQNTDNPVEIIGIEKTLKNIEQADLILFVVEEGHGLQAEDFEIYKKVADKPLFIVINKKDLENVSQPILLPDEWGGNPSLRISALKGEGLAALEKAIYGFVAGGQHGPMNTDFAPNLRQKQLIQNSLRAAQAALESKEREGPGELTALDLDECLLNLNAILGKHMREDILERIFSEFCIGK